MSGEREPRSGLRSVTGSASSVLALARLAIREHAPGYALAGALLGAVVAASALGFGGEDPAPRARLALATALAAVELAAMLVAALAGAIGLGRDLALGRAATFLARPVARWEYAGAAFAGALLSSITSGAAALFAGVATIAALTGTAGLDAITPRVELVPPVAALGSGAPRSLAAGETLPWTFEPPPSFRAGALLRFAPRYQFLGDELESTGLPIPSALRVRLVPIADGRALEPIEFAVPTVGEAFVPLPEEALRAARVRLVLEPLTRGAVVGLGKGSLALLGPPESLLVGGSVALLGFALMAGFVAALAVAGAAIVGDRIAAVLALTLGLAARTTATLRAIPASGTDEHAHGHAVRELVPSCVDRALRAILDGAGAALPDLSRADLAAALRGGRAAAGTEILHALAAPMPWLWIACALILAAVLLSRREVGLGGAEAA